MRRKFWDDLFESEIWGVLYDIECEIVIKFEWKLL